MSKWGNNIPDEDIEAMARDLCRFYEEEQEADRLSIAFRKTAILKACAQCERLWAIKNSVRHGMFQKVLKDLGYTASADWRSKRMQLHEHVAFIRENIDEAAAEVSNIKKLKTWVDEKILNSKFTQDEFCQDEISPSFEQMRRSGLNVNGDNPFQEGIPSYEKSARFFTRSINDYPRDAEFNNFMKLQLRLWQEHIESADATKAMKDLVVVPFRRRI